MAGLAIPERLAWTIERLDIQPTDRLLEIGCGRGIAVSLICSRLSTGTIMAIDRSQVAIEAARAQNRDHVTSGKAIFHATALAEADLAGHGFDKVFAVNVNVFWTAGARELAIVRDALAVRGVMFLVFQPPADRQLRALAETLTSALTRSGFSVDDVLVERDKTPLLCVTARAKLFDD